MARGSGAVVLITGASAGIGLATADRLAEAGWRVFGASRRGSRGQSSTWEPMVMDVDDEDSVRDGVARLVAETGRLDAVVANAGWGLGGPVEETPLQEAKDQLETNFFGAARLVRAALPVMRRQQGGRIVLVSSIAGQIGVPFQAYYSASKFALEGFGEALSYEVAPFGISVSLVEPGNVRTDFTKARRRGGAGELGEGPYRAASEKALGRMERDEAAGAPPEAVAAAIERVLSSPRPPRRRSVGRLDERVGILAKRLIPYRLFERAARSSLGL